MKNLTIWKLTATAAFLCSLGACSNSASPEDELGNLGVKPVTSATSESNSSSSTKSNSTSDSNSSTDSTSTSTLSAPTDLAITRSIAHGQSRKKANSPVQVGLSRAIGTIHYRSAKHLCVKSGQGHKMILVIIVTASRKQRNLRLFAERAEI